MRQEYSSLVTYEKPRPHHRLSEILALLPELAHPRWNAMMRGRQMLLLKDGDSGVHLADWKEWCQREKGQHVDGFI